MSLPKQYNWLASEGAPKMLLEALKEFGAIETPGAGNNKKIIDWGKEVGLGNVYTADSIAWCGLFMAVIAKRAGKQVVKDPLWALNWGNFGNHSKTPMLGDVLVFIRNGGGHVGLYVGEDSEACHVLGGNQSDSVCISRIAKSRLYTCRRPDYSIGVPKNVRKVLLAKAGTLSVNEA